MIQSSLESLHPLPADSSSIVGDSKVEHAPKSFQDTFLSGVSYVYAPHFVPFASYILALNSMGVF